MSFAVTYDFISNTVISSSNVNTNYADIETAINSIHSYIGAGVITNAMLAGSIDLTSKVTGTLPVANGGTEFDTGDVCLSTAAKDESGWTEITSTYSGRYLRAGSTGLATGGASGHTHTGPSHTHSISYSGTTAASSDTNGAGGAGISSNPTTHTHTYSGSGTSGSEGTGNTGAASSEPLYVDMRLFSRS